MGGSGHLKREKPLKDQKKKISSVINVAVEVNPVPGDMSYKDKNICLVVQRPTPGICPLETLHPQVYLNMVAIGGNLVHSPLLCVKSYKSRRLEPFTEPRMRCRQ